jgi:hypothetical protein
MTPEELNELTDKSFLEPVMSGNYFTEWEDEAVNRKEKIYNTALETQPAAEISKIDQKVNDRDAASFKIIPEGLTEVLVGSSTAFKAVAIPTETDAVPNDPCVTWESSDKEVADFMDNLLNATKAGEIIITATDTFNSSEPVSLAISVKEAAEASEEEEETERDGEFDYVFDEATWNESYQTGGLKLYYASNPSEDLWNNTENRGANYNDRHYEGTLDGESVEADIRWASDNSQKLIIGSAEYYAAIFYDFELRELPLFNDAELTVSAEKTFVMTAGYYVNCEHSYKGWTANGARAPWIVMKLPIPFEGTIRFSYEGKEDVYPWGESIRTFQKGWAVASIPDELGEEFLVDSEGNTSFDITKFSAKLILG